MARRGQLHVPRLPGVRPDRRRGRGPLGADRGLGAGDPSGHTREGAEEAVRQGADHRPRAADPAADQGQLSFARPPPRVPRLHRRQEVLRGRPGDRRAPVPRPLHDARVQGEPAVDPDHSRQGRRAYWSAPGSRRQATTARRCSRSSSRTRATRFSRWGPRICSTSRSGSSASASASGSAVPMAGPARAIRRVPGVHPARPLQHREPREGRTDPDGGARRGRRSTGRSS